MLGCDQTIVAKLGEKTGKTDGNTDAGKLFVGIIACQIVITAARANTAKFGMTVDGGLVNGTCIIIKTSGDGKIDAEVFFGHAEHYHCVGNDLKLVDTERKCLIFNTECAKTCQHFFSVTANGDEIDDLACQFFGNLDLYKLLDNLVLADLFDLVNDTKDFFDLVGKTECGEEAAEDFSVVDADGEITDAELFEYMINDSGHFGIIEDVKLLAADDIDVALIKFAESALLGTLTAINLAHLIALEGENEIVLMLCNITRKRNGEVKAKGKVIVAFLETVDLFFRFTACFGEKNLGKLDHRGIEREKTEAFIDRTNLVIHIVKKNLIGREKLHKAGEDSGGHFFHIVSLFFSKSILYHSIISYIFLFFNIFERILDDFFSIWYTVFTICRREMKNMRRSTLSVGVDTPIERFYGIGEKRAEAFHKLGIFRAEDLVYHFPRAYEPRGNVKTTATAEDGEVCSLILTVANEPKTAMIRKGMTLTKFTAFDENGTCSVTFFNQPYIRDFAHKGMTFRFFGKVKKEGKNSDFYTTFLPETTQNAAVSMISPIMEAVSPRVPLRSLVPVYPLTSGISQKLMGNTVKEALNAVKTPENELKEFLPAALREKYALCSIHEALTYIHAPNTLEETTLAVRRLAFDELYLFALAMMQSKEKTIKKAVKPLKNPEKQPFFGKLAYKPTSAQMRVMNDMERDLTSGTLMNRLIVGDVGSGKTICAAYAVYIALSSGKQAALMAPTEILARQHFEELSVFFADFGYKTELLVGSMTASAKKKAVARLASGEAHFVIGTHALIEDTVEFSELSLAVIDEQHRFGTAQRRKLSEKNENVHVLSMSATPIPRTLAMVMYCDTEVSIIDEMPPGRQKVDTFLVNEGYRKRLNAFIRKNIEAGGQVYIVCPAVEEEEVFESENGEKMTENDLIPLGNTAFSEKTKKKAATVFAAELAEIFPEYKVAFVHGRLNGKEKDRIMTDFAAGNTKILVSTTVIEVGVNVPNATLMIVENAELFGLSALHQLRGRVGRGQMKSYCVLVSESKSEKARERLKLLCETNDGFKVAEKDLEMRGPGDFLEQNYGKTRQSGEFDLGIASLERDLQLLYTAFDEAKRTLEHDPELQKAENIPLADRLRMKNKPQNL